MNPSKLKRTKSPKMETFFAFFECANTEYLGRQALLKSFCYWVRFVPTDGFEAGTAGYKARTLPLCYAVSPKNNETYLKLFLALKKLR